MINLFIFGMGYCGARIAEAVRAKGGIATGTTRDGRNRSVPFDEKETVAGEIARATHILSSIAPDAESDPVLDIYGDMIERASAGWIGYISSTGVYGDTGGAWVDESAPIGTGRRSARAAADLRWQGFGERAHIFRLPGIYGPGRSPIDRVRSGKAHRIDIPGQVFSRVHVADIVSGVIAGMSGPAGAYNLADDMPAPQNDVIAHAAALIGQEPPPLQSLDEASLSAAARAFYSENRRVANGRAKRLLGWTPRYTDYRAGLRALIAMTSPTSASTQPDAARNDHS